MRRVARLVERGKRTELKIEFLWRLGTPESKGVDNLEEPTMQSVFLDISLEQLRCY